MTPPALAARSRAAAVPAPLRQPVGPRRLSGPARHPRAAPPARRRSRGAAVRLLDAPFLDRLIRGRVWIALVAFALLGIVAMQVTILQLGSSIGRSVIEIGHLTAANQAAETAIARDEPGSNVASEAASLGMVYPPAGNIVYLHFAAGDAGLGAASITLPTAALFTPAAASLTAPIQPVVANATTSSPASTPSTSSTTASGPASGTTTGTATTTSSGGIASNTPVAPSTTTALGSAGGSAAPGG
jgi:hypothetical protein